MSRRFATLLLACAALGSLVFAGVRIAGARSNNDANYEAYVRSHPAPPAHAAATLASLHRPPGFRDAACPWKEGGWRCWSKSPSLPLGERAMRRLLAAIGARPYVGRATREGVPAIHCGPLHGVRRYDLAVEMCNAKAVMGKERLVMFVTSWLLPSGKPSRRTPFPAARYPTEVHVSVV